MKVKFIIEKGAYSEDKQVNIKTLIVKNPVIITQNFCSDMVIAEGIVTKENGVLMCEADIPQSYFDHFPAIGYKIGKRAHTLLQIGLCNQKNEDKSIKTIREQIK
jgi:hypothetical protein